MPRSWPVPFVVAGLGAFPLVTGETGSLGGGLRGSRPAVWAALTVILAIPTVTAWGFGVLAGVRRRRRADTAARDRQLVDQAAAAAASAEHGRIGAGLRSTARHHAEAVVTAADEGRLDLVLAEARAGLAALRELLTELREPPPSNGPTADQPDGTAIRLRPGGGRPRRRWFTRGTAMAAEPTVAIETWPDVPGGPDGDDEVPPVVDGIAVLAARRGAAAWYVGTRRPLPAAVEVTAYRVAEALLTDGAKITVCYVDGGIVLSGPAPRSGRRLRAMTDAAGGSLAATNDGAVRVWLPEVSPSRFG